MIPHMFAYLPLFLLGGGIQGVHNDVEMGERGGASDEKYSMFIMFTLLYT